MAPSTLFARQKYPEAAVRGIKQPSLAITQARCLEGKQDAHIAKEIEEVLKFDLNLAGSVKIISDLPKENASGIRPGEFDFAPWRIIGAVLLLKTGYVIDGEDVIVEFRLYDVQKEKQLHSAVYTGKRRFLRKMAHAFADETMRAVTDEEGPFAGHFVFVSARTGNKEVYIMDYDGYNERRVTRNGSINLNPSFSPDGREIIYTSYKKEIRICTGERFSPESRPGYLQGQG